MEEDNQKKETEKKLDDENLEEGVTKRVISEENKQLIWFFLIVIVVFASFLVPYFYIEGQKKFEYAGIDWIIEPFGDTEIYHGMFMVFDGRDKMFNIFLRGDPRENNIKAEGEFNVFRETGFISMSREVGFCSGGQVGRAIIDLGGFLKGGVGVRNYNIGSSDEKFANETGIDYLTCEMDKKITAVIIEKGEISFINQSQENPFCYTISVTDCNDIAPIEKFIVESISAFKETGINTTIIY